MQQQQRPTQAKQHQQKQGQGQPQDLRHAEQQKQGQPQDQQRHPAERDQKQGQAQHQRQPGGRGPSGGKVLSKDESHSAIQQANAARAGLHGVNSRPIPSGEVTKHEDGRMTVRASGGRDYTLRPNGSLSRPS